ncbi:MAG TPA: M56 family metallopeptidase [Verrucomicrobiae bacterium]|nr:M56 family metallopeptidase [Verrucomicrobiae bacterium]
MNTTYTMALRFLEGLGRVSAQGAVLICMVLLAQWMFRRWLTPHWRCALWLLVVGRLILPVSLPTRVSVFNFTPAARGASSGVANASGLPSTEAPDQSFVSSAPAPAPSYIHGESSVSAPNAAERPDKTPERISSTKNAPVAGSAPVVTSSRRFSWSIAMFALWLIGAGMLAGHVLVSSIRVTRRVRKVPSVTDPAVLSVLEQCRVRMRVRTPLRLVEGASIHSPALHGVFRPRLLLPAGFTQTFSAAELHFIFLHELAHVKRRDVLVNWIVTVLQIVHWFNPLVWVGFMRWRADRELACDALALETAGEGRNQEYGRTILRLLERITHQAAAPGLVGIMEDKRQMKERIGMIAAFVPARRWSLLAVVLLGGLAVAGLTDAQDNAKGSRAGKPVEQTASAPSQPTQSVSSTAGLPKVSVTNGSSMKVLVLDAEHGQPLANAEILAPDFRAFFGGSSSPPRWTTDQNGVAMIRLGEVPSAHLQQQSWFSISVQCRGYAPRGLSWAADNKDVRPGMPSEVTVRLARGLTAGGVVRDEQGTPLRGVRVKIFGSGYWRGLRQEFPQFWADSVVTDSAGRWSIEDFPRDLDLIRIEIFRPDGSSQRFVQEGESDPREIGAPVRLADLRAGKAALVFRSGLRVRGRVLEPNGAPLSQVLIKTGYGMGNPKSAGETRTDAAGRFEFQHLSAGQLILTAYPTNFAITSLVVDVATNIPEVRLVVAPMRPLRVRVEDGRGQAVGGAKLGVEKYRSEAQALDFEATVDDNGAFIWSNAPVAPFALVAIGKLPFHEKMLITSEQRDVTFKLREGMDQEIIINGRVKNARTKAGVKLESVQYQTGDHEGFQWPGEVSEGGFQLKVPAARFRPGGSYPSFQLELRAKGYATLITPWRDFDLGDWDADFVMQPADDVRKVVLRPNGEPAARAKVWIQVNPYETVFCNGPDRYAGDRLSKEQADDAGAFVLPSVPEDLALVVTHVDGFLATTYGEVGRAREVRLQPWGTVRGRVLVDGQTKAGLYVMLQCLLWSPQMGWHLNYHASTARDGGFVFTNVPAGEYKLCRWLTPPGQTGRSITESHPMPITVKAGEVLEVQYGGGGRAVIGQAISDKVDQTVDWLSDDHLLVLKQPPAPAPVNIDQFATASAYRKAYDATFGTVKLQEARAARLYQLEFERDGSFRAEDVPPGTYDLRIRLTNPGQPGERQFATRAEDELGSLVREVIVPPGTTALDLGSLMVPIKDDPTLKRAARVSLEAQTLDGQPISLHQYQGKYTLIAFWASWSERSAEQFAEWNKLQNEWAREERIAFLSINLDDDAATARQASAALQPGWRLARLEGPPRTMVTEAFNVETLPALFLIDPDGRLVGRNLEGSRVRATVERALKK